MTGIKVLISNVGRKFGFPKFKKFSGFLGKTFLFWTWQLKLSYKFLSEIKSKLYVTRSMVENLCALSSLRKPSSAHLPDSGPFQSYFLWQQKFFHSSMTYRWTASINFLNKKNFYLRTAIRQWSCRWVYWQTFYVYFLLMHTLYRILSKSTYTKFDSIVYTKFILYLVHVYPM